MNVLKVRRLNDDAVIPTKHHASDAGFDLYSDGDYNITRSIWVPTGIALEIPEGYVGIVKERSSKAGKYGVGAGVIDSGYRGEVMVWFRIESRVSIRKGEKIAQLLLIKLDDFTVKEVTELDDSERGTDGFGSSGM